jgi:hypothetical protein
MKENDNNWRITSDAIIIVFSILICRHNLFGIQIITFSGQAHHLWLQSLDDVRSGQHIWPQNRIQPIYATSEGQGASLIVR